MPNGLVIVDNLLLIKFMMKMMIVPLGISKLNTRANNDWSASGGSGANPKTGGERRGSLTCSQVQLLLLRDQRRSQVTSLILIISAIFLQFLQYRRHVDDVFHTLVREIRKRDEEGEFKENETSRWKKVWNNIFKTIKRGRRKV